MLLRSCTYLVTVLIGVFSIGVAQASPNSLTFQGRILKSDNTPLEYANVSFLFEIMDPNGACLIYEEQIDNIDMRHSGGVFDVPIGSGTRTYPTVGSYTVLDAFNNSTPITCKGGSNYTPGVNDIRKLRVQFYDGVGWKLINPDSVIRSVPYSAYSYSASKLGNNLPADFILKNDITACPANTFLSFDGANFNCAPVSGASGGTVTNVSSANAYVTIANSSSTPLVTLNVGTSANTVAAGNDPRIVNAIQSGSAASGDLNGTYPGPSVVALRGVGVANTVPTSGQFLKFNGTNWTPAAIAIADVTNLSSTLSGYQTSAAFNTAVGSANCAAYETPYWNSVAGKFLCQAINVSLAGDVSGSIGAASVDKIKGYDIDLSSAPINGQVLKYNGTKWVAGNDNNGGGTVTSVSASAPLSVTNGTTTPSITLSQATASTNGYLSSADWNTFNSKQATGNYVTALTGDVTASGPGSAAATVAKLQGSTLTITTPANKDYLKFNGTAFVNSPLLASDLSGAIPAANLPAFTGDVTSSAGSTTLTLAAAGTAGTYYKVTTDSKGRVTSGSASLVAADIPALDWSKITTGKPNSLSGYGIIDALVSNAGGTPSIQTGLDASKPSSPSAGAIYFATDSKVIYQYNSGAWISIASATGSGGTITGVTAGTGLSGGGTTGTVTLNLANTAVTAGSYTRPNITVDAQGRLTAAANGAAINLTTEVTGILPIANGGTGASTALGAINALSPLTTKGDILTRDTTNNIRLAVGTNGQVLSADSTQASGLKWITPNAGTVMNVTGTSPITVTNNSTTPAISVDAATTSTQGVVQIGSGIAVSSGTISADPANFPSAVPVSKGGTGTTSITANSLVAANGTGSAYQSFTCGVGQIITFNASGVAGCTSYTAAGIFLNGGNSFGGAATLGTNDANTLGFKTNNAVAMTIDATGKIGIGKTNPSVKLDIADGIVKISDTTMPREGGELELAGSPNSGGMFYIDSYDSTGAGKEILRLRSDQNSNILNLTRAGNVSVGMINPSDKMQINGNLRIGAQPAGTDDNLDYYVTSGGQLHIRANDSGVAEGNWVNLYLEAGTGGSPGSIKMVTSGTDRMIVGSNGYVGIGTNAPAALFHVNGPSYLAGTPMTDCPSGWGCTVFAWDISASGLYYSALQQRSDRRLKRDISSLQPKEWLNRILQLRPVEYDWKDPRNGTGHQYGFIAQEVEQVIPELVRTGDDPMQTKSVNYINIIAPLVASVKEIYDHITGTDKVVAQLKEKTNQLELQNEKMRAYLCAKDPHAPFCESNK